MKTFNDYVNLRELAAYDVGTDILGKSSLDDKSKDAVSTALKAFMMVLNNNTMMALSFLQRQADSDPEVKSLLDQVDINDVESFKDPAFKSGVRRAAMKGGRYISKGLGDVSPMDGNNVIAPSSADSFHNPMN